MQNKFLKYFLILILVAIILAGGYFTYKYFSNKQTAPVACTMEAKLCPDGSSVGRIGPKCEFAPCPDQVANWKTYTNTQYGFEFKYPSEFFYWEPKTLVGDCNYNVFPDQCPNINNIVANEQIAEGGDSSAIQNNIQYFPKGEKTTINGTNFCLYKTGEGAMGSMYFYNYYTTIKNQKCFVIQLVTRLTNCGVYGTIGEKAYEDCILYNETTYPQKLNQLLSTFTFTK